MPEKWELRINDSVYRLEFQELVSWIESGRVEASDEVRWGESQWWEVSRVPALQGVAPIPERVRIAKQEAARARVPAMPPDQRRCPACAEFVQGLAVRCRFCGAAVGDPAWSALAQRYREATEEERQILWSVLNEGERAFLEAVLAVPGGVAPPVRVEERTPGELSHLERNPGLGSLQEQVPSVGQAVAGPGRPVGQKVCPFCAELVLAEAIKCRFCGSSIVDSGWKRVLERYLVSSEGERQEVWQAMTASQRAYLERLVAASPPSGNTLARPEMVSDSRLPSEAALQPPRRRIGPLGWGCLSLLAIMVLARLGGPRRDTSVREQTETLTTVERVRVYGIALAQVSAGQLRFKSAALTTGPPFVAYKIVFETDDPTLLSIGDYGRNLARTEAWQEQFCTEPLATVMRSQGIGAVSGELVDRRGATQRMAVCTR